MADIIETAARRLNLPVNKVRATAQLLASGATIPFISRYRKEVTGNLNEIEINNIQLEIERLTRLEERRDAIIEAIRQQDKLSDDLLQRINEASTAAELEDLYLPYRPKRRTRASIARDRGLEPLARMIMSDKGLPDPQAAAERFVKGEVKSPDEALAGALDIIAEWIAESVPARNIVRNHLRREAVVRASLNPKADDPEKINTFRAYASFSHPMRSIASHQYLALQRGQAEGVLRLSIDIDDDKAIDEVKKRTIKQSGTVPSRKLVADAVDDGYRRLLRPQIETEVDALWRETAEKAAINIFSDNLRQLLLAAPLRERNVLAIDPGYRTGCKVVALDSNGNLLADDIIYPNEPKRDTVAAMRTLMRLIDEYEIEAIALGDRTASRATADFLRSSGIADFCEVFVVSENGASVYSASDLAREEFPDKDVTVRGAVSIGRPLIDPLAELVKIDPKSIGVGQYQHDVDQTELRRALDFVVESCVNSVGVNLNTASPQLLGYVAGIGRQMAARIVEYRTAHGAFASRHDLLNVPRLGAKIFEQAAGFLRVPESSNPLDNTGIHPESYAIVERMARDLNVDTDQLPANNALIDRIDPTRYADAGQETVSDIIAELRRPGRDPREGADNVEFDPTIKEIDDVKPGMILPGKVNNITAFGAFIDIGIKENGLLHVSQMGRGRRVSNPAEVVKINQIINVKVLDVDLERRRISLSIKDL